MKRNWLRHPASAGKAGMNFSPFDLLQPRFT
jgi:hypothetical protein